MSLPSKYKRQIVITIFYEISQILGGKRITHLLILCINEFLRTLNFV